MRPWLRYSLLVLAALLLLAAGGAFWLLRSFDGARLQQLAADWMLQQHQRTLRFEGPVSLQLWPQPALAVQKLSLSERGRPDEVFARIEQAALSLRLEPLLARRVVQVDRVSARGVVLRYQRDAQGLRNIDDLLALATGSPAAPTGTAAPLAIDALELSDAALDIDDAQSGLKGQLAIDKLTLGALAPGLQTPLSLQARANFEEPELSAALTLQAGLTLPTAREPGAPMVLQLAKPLLHLQGEGFDLQQLDAHLQADSLQLSSGGGEADLRLQLSATTLQWSGRRLGWQMDGCRLAVQQLQFGLKQRQLALDGLVLALQGQRAQTTLQAQLRWPQLSVQGDALRGSALDGELQLGGDQQLSLRLSSQPPSGAFERITWPELKAQIDGRVGGSQLQGQAGATLVFAPRPLSAGLDALSLQLRVQDPGLPPLQLALDGQLQLGTEQAQGQLAGTVNDQRMDARFTLQERHPRPFLDMEARFGRLDLTRFARPPAPGAPAARQGIDLQPLLSADARLQISATQLLYPPYRIGALALRASVQDGRLQLSQLNGQAWGGRFEATGSADANNQRLALQLRADAVDLRGLLTDTLGFDGLRGRGRIDADLQGRGPTVDALRASLNGRVGLALRPAALRGVDLAQTLRGWRTATQDQVQSDAARQTEFSQLDASLQFRDGVARSDDLDGRSDFLQVGGSGQIDLVRQTLDYQLRVRVVNTAGGRAGPEMVLLNGVTVPVALSGPFGAVEWRVPWAQVTAAAAALSVPNVAVGTVTGVARGATGVVRGAAGLLRGGFSAAASAPR